MRVCTSFLVCFALLATVAQRSDAQIVLDGRVLDDMTGRPLAGARVFLLTHYRKVIGYAETDRDGSFSFSRRSSGVFRLEAKAVGFRETVTTPVWITEDRDSATVEIRLTRHAVLLAPLEIVAMSEPRTSAVLENVEHRMASGFGYHLTREDIERRNPTYLSDILLTLPGIRAEGSRPGGGRSIQMRRALPGLPGGCPVGVFLDGVLVNRGVDRSGVSIDDLASPLDVEVIEVFQGLSSIPPEFLTPEARCGVVAIWTRRSGGNEG